MGFWEVREFRWWRRPVFFSNFFKNGGAWYFSQISSLFKKNGGAWHFSQTPLKMEAPGSFWIFHSSSLLHISSVFFTFFTFIKIYSKMETPGIFPSKNTKTKILKLSNSQIAFQPPNFICNFHFQINNRGLSVTLANWRVSLLLAFCEGEIIQINIIFTSVLDSLFR